jgi:hypothetical protein
MLHDPTRLTDGIEPSDDPVLAARRGVYELSVLLKPLRTSPQSVSNDAGNQG